MSPDYKEAHNYCGNLHHRLGNLTAAQAAYDTVLALAKAEKDNEAKAAALGNLGNLAYTRGDLAAAKGYYAQALKLNQDLGRKEGMANQYGNLGGLEHERRKYGGQSLTLNQARERGIYATLVAWNMRGEIWQGRGRFGCKRAIFMQRSGCPIWLKSFRGGLTA